MQSPRHLQDVAAGDARQHRNGSVADPVPHGPPHRVTWQSRATSQRHHDLNPRTSSSPSVCGPMRGRDMSDKTTAKLIANRTGHSIAPVHNILRACHDEAAGPVERPGWTWLRAYQRLIVDEWEAEQ